ncbi:30S ribosomal protein S4 [bacterium (Candidatus Gribaldobacteria) CG_4_10_14_0_8_um_filter_33_9]|uniref:Small ribosomal subunit protein uS4 n=1 Tax=bacterium (Candidatus Gribaldobacteria) CG_4_10_14_0_8_um_filter_33_9 TaxID=2014266 RepID=A0A2M7RN43_9BACT|nr:MAG: 30S ribosomal protein S4 [bacterium (Candidatus Gribaldobacteria) CG_4_10_14_0_8_um_filter_33_9]
MPKKKNFCTICRRVSQKLFLKGEKCVSTKCSLIKKSYIPGIKSKKIRPGTSDYKKELMEKQKMKEFYGISEKQFKGYVKGILKKKGKVEDASLELIKKLEKRLDNIIFRLGFASSRAQSRQLVSHGYFLVNGRTLNISSCQIENHDIISFKEQKKGKMIFKEIVSVLKKKECPSWLKLDKETIKGEIVAEPSLESAGIPAEISSVFEFYSK